MHSIIHYQFSTLPLRPKTHTVKVPLLPSAHDLFTPKFNGLPFRALSLSHKPKTAKSSISINAKTTLSDSSAFLETKDLSFLQQSPSWSNEKKRSVVDAAQLEEDSKVVVCMGTLQFVDYLCSVAPPPIALTVLHYSLLELADVKENHDSVRCRQGDIVDMPSSWGALDVVFINYLSALTCSLPLMFQALVKQCKPGARVIISDTHGRAQLKANKQSHSDVITGDLPDKVKLEKLLHRYPLQLIRFTDEPDFYFIVLKVLEGKNSRV